MIVKWGDHFGQRTVWSFIFFLNYVYLEIWPSVLYFCSPSTYLRKLEKIDLLICHSSIERNREIIIKSYVSSSSWATPMSFVSINSTNPRIKPWKYHEKILKFGRTVKWHFLRRLFDFFYSKKIFFFSSSYQKDPRLPYEVSFFSALWMVSLESWKRGCPN